MATDIQLARAASVAALATEGVHAMGRGRFVEAATYEGAEKVSGVVVDPEKVEIHVVVRWPLPKPIPEIAGSIRERVAPEAAGRRTIIMVDDLEVGADENL
ncbi:hypothetical protein [Rubrobacter tropicus]|uniref:hypothetical protein n=1 Tax=Rubrobacter tropicus TaxID=2653851 RepID=UPI001D17E505|nr:hypothetical protein [Rubrobacter tropicus]